MKKIDPPAGCVAVIAASALLFAGRHKASGHANDRDRHLEGAACREKVIAKLDQWAPERVWIPQVAPDTGVRSFKTPTSRIGTWIESEIYPDRHVEISRYHQSVDGKRAFLWQELATWDKSDCLEKSVVDDPIFDLAPDRPFTDADLEKFVRRHPDGAVVYTWSPNMPLSEESVLFITRAVAQLNARGRKLGLVFVADPDLSREQIEDGAKRIDALYHVKIKEPKQMFSLELKEVGAPVHYPSLIVYSKGRLRNLIPGAMGTDRYIELLKGAL